MIFMRPTKLFLICLLTAQFLYTAEYKTSHGIVRLSASVDAKVKSLLKVAIKGHDRENLLFLCQNNAKFSDASLDDCKHNDEFMKYIQAVMQYHSEVAAKRPPLTFISYKSIKKQDKK